MVAVTPRKFDLNFEIPPEGIRLATEPQFEAARRHTTSEANRTREHVTIVGDRLIAAVNASRAQQIGRGDDLPRTVNLRIIDDTTTGVRNMTTPTGGGNTSSGGGFFEFLGFVVVAAVVLWVFFNVIVPCVSYLASQVPANHGLWHAGENDSTARENQVQKPAYIICGPTHKDHCWVPD